MVQIKSTSDRKYELYELGGLTKFDQDQASPVPVDRGTEQVQTPRSGHRPLQEASKAKHKPASPSDFHFSSHYPNPSIDSKTCQMVSKQLPVFSL